MRPSIGVTPVREIMRVRKVCWRFVGCGEVRMRSHAERGNEKETIIRLVMAMLVEKTAK